MGRPYASQRRCHCSGIGLNDFPAGGKVGGTIRAPAEPRARHAICVFPRASELARSGRSHPGCRPSTPTTFCEPLRRSSLNQEHATAEQGRKEAQLLRESPPLSFFRPFPLTLPVVRRAPVVRCAKPPFLLKERQTNERTSSACFASVRSGCRGLIHRGCVEKEKRVKSQTSPSRRVALRVSRVA